MKVLEPILTARQLTPAMQIAGSLMVERLMFDTAKAQAEGYTGGLWGDLNISKGCAIATVPGEGTVRIQSAANYCDVTTTRESAGAAFTLIAVNLACWYFHEKGHSELSAFLSDYFHKLRDAVLSTKTLDIPAILSIID